MSKLDEKALDAAISPYEWLAQEWERLAVLRKMWTAHEVAAMIRRHDIERDPHPAATIERLTKERDEWRSGYDMMDKTASSLGMKLQDAEARADTLAAELAKAREALVKIMNHPESHNDRNGGYGVGWAFFNVQSIARAALPECQCDSPVVKCDERGCYCIMCGKLA